MNNTKIKQLLSDENVHLDKLHKIVKETLEAKELIVHNLVNPPVEVLTQGQKLSDRVAQFGGSWRFIRLFGIVLAGWIIAGGANQNAVRDAGKAVCYAPGDKPETPKSSPHPSYMTRLLLVALLFLISRFADAQQGNDWIRLRQYAQDIGVDSLCAQPDSACVSRYFTEIVYGRTPRRMSYQGIPATVDTVRIARLTRQFLSGSGETPTDWCPLLDSLESHDRHYRQLLAYGMRCLIDDYLCNAVVTGQVQETLNTYRWRNRFPANRLVLVNIPSATLRVVDRQ
ncbi:MAG: hypothetical protein LH609_18665 [Rudanella sp.]|nr:hypothetical protein [Rudanella sp.]